VNDISEPAAVLILAATITISILGLYRFPRLIERMVLRPYRVARGKGLATTLTSGLVHGDLGHLFFNMFTFYFFAFPLERYIGTGLLAALYTLGLFLSSLCSVHKHRDAPGYATLGASGAISAVLFAFIVYFPTTTLILLPIPIPIPAALFAVGYVAYSWWAARNPHGRINHDAHLCGAFSGLLFVALTDPGAYTDLLKRVI